MTLNRRQLMTGTLAAGALYASGAHAQSFPDKPITIVVAYPPGGDSDATARVKQWQETLPNGVTYKTLDCVDNGFYDNTNVYTVPPGHFFIRLSGAIVSIRFASSQRMLIQIIRASEALR